MIVHEAVETGPAALPDLRPTRFQLAGERLEPLFCDMAIVRVTEDLLQPLDLRIVGLSKALSETALEHFHRVAQALAGDANQVKVVVDAEVACRRLFEVVEKTP